ncbi:MAG: hypothetical protein J6A01_06100, partial [Proteobacteria bacterium]|nr:hypothetical protein [Pseudomonadota bacterium]
MSIKFNYLFAAVVGLASFVPATAFAEHCDGLEKNASWQAGMANLISQLEKEDYDAAIETAKPLFAICSTMPSLNYYTAMAMQKKDPQRALLYLQEAAKRTSQFTTT